MAAAALSVIGTMVFCAVVVAFMMLTVRPKPGTDPRTITEAAQKYARRIGMVALGTALWLPGVLQPVLRETGGELWWDGHYAFSSAVVQLGAPTVFALAVLAAGELTWPRPRGTVRTARLEHRGVRALIPRYMTGLACIFLAYNLLILATTLARDPGSVPARQLLAGWAPWLLLTVAAVAGVLKLISVRPAVPGTAPEADAALRRASAHRVLRTAAAVMLLLASSGGIFLGNYPDPPGLSPAADGLRNLSLPLLFAGILALFKRAPRVPLPEPSAFAGAVPASSPLAVKSLASSLRLTIGGTLLAGVAWIGIFAPNWEYRTAAPLALAAAAGSFTFLCALTEYTSARRIRKHSPAAGPLDPGAYDFVRPPRWLGWTGTAAAALALGTLLGTALLAPSVDRAAQAFAESAANARSGPGAGQPGPVTAPEPFFDWRFALAATLLVLLLPLLTYLVSRKVLARPALPADRDVDLRLRRVALFRLARTSTATCLAAAGLVFFDVSLHSPWAHTYIRDIEVEPPLTWLAPLVQQSNAVASLLLLAAIVVAWRQFGPSHFPDDPRYAERADLSPAQRA
ncbi:hypothetical protein LOC59_02810 [Arthrobacter sp. zg-Y916]|uniref:Uncharacterized protein n=1 Tax=Arthrobacter caoxuetaonis TaxID=2886935 RepID=A0A9X1MCX9_9MICC|nr:MULTISPECIES: hypothetical protein [Arthrobacter]MCC3296509.1 hypothetical protein [Arthrobacter caoxuetaonis]MCC9192585.1 hypothetical protein [Arthrobacter sp. zg-Y916]USQ56658.1 hypothetical protein NF551_13025 [Arthrobacter caoxuetaonis]